MADGHNNLWSTGGYGVNTPPSWAPPVLPSGSTAPRYDQTMRPIKRQLSESDDCEDVFSEETKERCSSPAEDCQMGFSRKKRRGIIEKRRRDRINSSLSELRRLVPTAFEKQGSAKLEKAEILQMTVDHLKTLHSKGLDALAYDPHKFAMDYHSIGFRECAAEVARYLVTVEGMDIQDPLRLRLMSHLQCFAAQRELASKQASTAWNYNTYGGIHDYPPTNSYDAPPTQHHQSLPTHHIPPIPTTPTTHIPHPSTNRQGATLLPADGRLQHQSSEPDHMVRHHSGDSLSPNRHLQHSDNKMQIQNSIQASYQSNHSYPSGFAQQGYNGSSVPDFSRCVTGCFSTKVEVVSNPTPFLSSSDVLPLAGESLQTYNSANPPLSLKPKMKSLHNFFNTTNRVHKRGGACFVPDEASVMFNASGFESSKLFALN